jgi:hypothetical protein
MLVFAGRPVGGYGLGSARYDPRSDTWVEMEPAPDLGIAYDGIKAVWDGREMLAWGGYRGYRDTLQTVGTGAKYTPYWLEVLVPTPVYSLEDVPIRMAASGEWFKVTRREGTSALVVREGEGGDESVWIALDDRVELRIR